jgi:tetratricopeptide (TPR) repeat protein
VIRLWAPAVILAAVWLSGSMVLTALPEQLRRPDELAGSPGRNAGASLVGEFRGSVAGYLWLKSDEYLHGGVRLRPMTEEEIARGAHRATSGDHVVAHEGFETSVVPAPELDPRGVWGDIERQVKPYYEMHGHKHRDPREAAPLFRFMTWVDPTFVPGYTVGAFIVRRSGPDGPEQAMRLLREGLAHNPESVAVHTEYGRALLGAKRYGEAEEELRTAIRLGKQARLSEWDAEALPHAYRWLVLLYREIGRQQDAVAWAKAGIELFPDDPIFERTLTGKPLPEIVEEHHHHHEH